MNPSHAELLVRIRARLTDAIKAGFVREDSIGPVQGVLLSILNDAEQARQKAHAAVARLREQAAAEEARAGAFSEVSSMAYAVLDAYVRKAEQAGQAALALAKEREDRIAASLALPPTETQLAPVREHVAVHPPARPGKPKKVKKP